MRSRQTASFLIALLAVLLALPMTASDDSLVTAAIQAYQQKDFARSADLFARAAEASEPDPSLFYNAACASALAGRKDAALAFLGRAVDAGYMGAEQMEKDTDLDSLHADVRWPALVERTRSNDRVEARLWGSKALSIPWAEDLPVEAKVAGLSKLWSEARYNFVNFDLVPDLDWDAVYLEALPRVMASRSTLDYYRILMETVARLHDGHSNVWPMTQLDRVFATPLLQTRLAGGRVFVSAVAGQSLRDAGIGTGDEIVAVDGIPVREYGDSRVRSWQSASTPQDLDSRVYERSLLAGAAGTAVKLSLRKPDGKTFDAEVTRVPRAEGDAAMKTPAFALRMLPGGIAHVVLNSFGSDEAAKQFDAHREEILGARGVILDVRENGGGNSSVGWQILTNFNGTERVVSKWTTRQYRAAYRAWKRPHGVVGGENRVGASAHPYPGPVVLLTSARTYSAAEDFAVAFRSVGAGSIVGEATGGSTGQPVMFDLPGGGLGRICARRDTFADGTEFVGVGVKPDVAVAPRVEDFANGGDAVLEEAVRVVKQKLATGSDKASAPPAG